MFFKQPVQIHLLMNGDTPTAAYLDKALADADCWVCNEGAYRLSEDQDYWVKPMSITTLVDEPAQN